MMEAHSASGQTVGLTDDKDDMLGQTLQGPHCEFGSSEEDQTWGLT